MKRVTTQGLPKLPLSWLYSNLREGVICSAKTFTGKEFIAYIDVPSSTNLKQIKDVLRGLYPNGFILHGLSREHLQNLMSSRDQSAAFGSVNSIDCKKKLRSIITNQIKRVENTHHCVFFDEENTQIMRGAKQIINARKGKSSGSQIVGLFRTINDQKTIKCAAYNDDLERVDAVVSASYIGEKTWHLEAFARHVDSLSGCTEIAIKALANRISEMGDQWLLLGETPFFIASDIPRVDKDSGLIEIARKGICYLGRKKILAYPVNGLYQYKRKFNKRNWETVYWYGYPSLTSADMLGVALITNSLPALTGNPINIEKKIEVISSYLKLGNFRAFSFKGSDYVLHKKTRLKATLQNISQF